MGTAATNLCEEAPGWGRERGVLVIQEIGGDSVIGILPLVVTWLRRDPPPPRHENVRPKVRCNFDHFVSWHDGVTRWQ